MTKPACFGCGAAVRHGSLFCSLECRDAHADGVESAVAELGKRGFARDALAPNVFRKQGVAITLEHVKHVGMVKALAQHAHAVAAGSGVSGAAQND